MGSHSVPWRPAALTAAHPASSRPLGCVLTGKMHASFGSLISYANRGHLAGGKAGRQHLPPKGRQARLLRLPPPNCRAGQGGPFPFHGRRIPTAGSWIRPRRYHCPCRRSFSPLPEFGRGSSTTKPRLKSSSRTRSAPATSDLRIRDDASGRDASMRASSSRTSGCQGCTATSRALRPGGFLPSAPSSSGNAERAWFSCSRPNFFKQTDSTQLFGIVGKIRSGVVFRPRLLVRAAEDRSRPNE